MHYTPNNEEIKIISYEAIIQFEISNWPQNVQWHYQYYSKIELKLEVMSLKKLRISPPNTMFHWKIPKVKI